MHTWSGWIEDSLKGTSRSFAACQTVSAVPPAALAGLTEELSSSSQLSQACALVFSHFFKGSSWPKTSQEYSKRARARGSATGKCIEADGEEFSKLHSCALE